ncbi:inositol monophosphatase family protein [Streptomyces sp. NPDC059894]|uniref:inositol monophosphatase family protein n=1 Tax=unclassified Streptomyces TaxID=2593676 RepID=UPI00365A58DD
MTPHDYRSFLANCLREAATIARRMADTSAVGAEVKADDPNQVVTPADLAIGQQLITRIRESFPEDSILDEETGPHHGNTPVTWIIDPLDGTSNYAAGSPLYGVIVAAIDARGPVAGGIALPAFDETYLAVRGHGAHLNGRALASLGRTPAHRSLVAHGLDKGSGRELATEARLVAALTARVQGVRMSNSVFDACQVARGIYGSYSHRKCRIWDIAAATCLINEVGGVATDLEGHPLDLTHPLDQAHRDFEVCLASPLVHPAVMSAAAQALSDTSSVSVMLAPSGGEEL